MNRASAPLAVFGWCFKLRPDKRRLYRAVGDLASMEKTGIREPLNSPIPHPGPLDSAPGPAPTTRGILQNLPATPSPNPTPSTPLGFVAADVLGRAGHQRRPSALGRETMAEVGRRPGNGRPSGGRTRLRDAGRGAFGRNAELRHRGLRARARLPAGLRPDGGAGRRYAFRSRCLRQSPREFGPGNCGARRWRPAHRALVEMAPRLPPTRN